MHAISLNSFFGYDYNTQVKAFRLMLELLRDEGQYKICRSMFTCLVIIVQKSYFGVIQACNKQWNHTSFPWFLNRITASCSQKTSYGLYIS